jgi:dihydroorotate dehydrogenase
MTLYKSLIRPLLFQCDPEWIHHTTIQAGRILGSSRPIRHILSTKYHIQDPRLQTKVCGIPFQNPIGLAAGYDKSGEAIPFLESLGFGHIEIGSISASLSHGNPKPRLFRLPQDQAVIVHYGLQNDGAETIAHRLTHRHHNHPLGINIVKTNRGIDAPADTEDDILTDYLTSVRLLKNKGDYLTLNLSCPNTEMGRDFFADKEHIVRFLQALSSENIPCPVFLKVSPIYGIPYIETLLEATEDFNLISGFIFNLAPGKTVPLKTTPQTWQTMPGAVAGKPVKEQMNTCIKELYQRMNKDRYHIIGIGGISTAEDAYEKIQLGASLVQLLTALIYEGPKVVHQINEGLCHLLNRDGLSSISQAIGTKNQ